jgi:hypothetical protein
MVPRLIADRARSLLSHDFPTEVSCGGMNRSIEREYEPNAVTSLLVREKEAARHLTFFGI